MSRTVLAVDDSASVRQLVRMTLAGAGYEVIEAVDGADAYAKATSRQVDVVLTDLNMPQMDGLEFVRRYRTHPLSRGVPIVFLSTESDEGFKQQARSAGATGWIIKPFRQEQLLTIIRKVAGQ